MNYKKILKATASAAGAYIFFRAVARAAESALLDRQFEELGLEPSFFNSLEEKRQAKKLIEEDAINGYPV